VWKLSRAKKINSDMLCRFLSLW